MELMEAETNISEPISRCRDMGIYSNDVRRVFKKYGVTLEGE